MTNDELRAQWRKCEEWKDPEQWELLALEYARCGYNLNAKRAFERADECRMNQTVELPVFAGMV